MALWICKTVIGSEFPISTQDYAEEEIDSFYEKLNEGTKTCKAHDYYEDLNANVGNGSAGKGAETRGLGERNEQGDR